MEKQKQNKSLRFARLALVLTLVTTCLLFSTLAKYTLSVSGADTARVAKLDFGANLTAYDEFGFARGTATPLGTTAATLSIFDTAYDSAASLLPASQTTVESTGVDKVIAPGVKGSFVYAVSGSTEVSIKIGFDITEAQSAAAAIPLLYKYGNDYYSNQYSTGSSHYFVLDNDGTTRTSVTIAGDLDALAVAASTAIGIIDAGTTMSGSTISNTNATVEWYWPFEDWTASSGGTLVTGTGMGSDGYDTALGAVGADTITLNIAATATQVD